MLSDIPFNFDLGAHDRLSKRGITEFVELCSDILKPGGTAFIICSAEQFVRLKIEFESNQLKVDWAPFGLVNSTQCNLCTNNFNKNRSENAYKGYTDSKNMFDTCLCCSQT